LQDEWSLKALKRRDKLTIWAKPIRNKSIGRIGLIDRIRERFILTNPSSLTGIGDDAAVIDVGKTVLVSTDMLIEGIYFDFLIPSFIIWDIRLWPNVSDIAAMNGRAEQITVNIALSNRFSIEADALYAGIKAACENYKVDLVEDNIFGFRFNYFNHCLGKSKERKHYL
jgi:thiamine monophosphate kinase